jgi:hypothetical protein
MARRLAPVLAIAALAAMPATAQAKSVVFGSALTAPADRIEAHGADSVFWSTSLPGGHKFRVPVKGRVATVKIKGTAVRQGGQDPNTLFHLQVLHPAHKRVRVVLTSGGFNIPVGGNPNRITIYHPINLCAKKRDFVAFNDIGGYAPPAYPQGTPFQIFSSVPGATTAFYSSSNGTNNGAKFKGAPHKGEELLMQMTVVTGKPAGICPH